MSRRQRGAAAALILVLALSGCGKEPEPPLKRARPAAAPTTPKGPPDPPEGLLAESGPDPDYPTPVIAGTNDLFLMEEPIRGPHVTEVALPDAATLAWTEHARAEVDEAGVVVSAAGPEPGGGRWRVGREGGLVRVVEELRPGGDVARRWVLEWAATTPPGLTLVATLDGYGSVVEARSYSPAGQRYTARARSGANALPGCGAVAVIGDGRGQVAETRCLAWHGTPMYDTSGVRTRRFERDAAGFVVAETCFGEGDRPAAAQSGPHRTTYERDAAGRVIRELRFGLDGAPARSSDDGCYGWAFGFDARGLPASETCLNGRGRPALDVTGVATTRRTFDERGCVVAERFLETTGGPCEDAEGVARREYRVGQPCEAASMACSGLGGNPVPCWRRGPAVIEYTRDARGRVVSERSFAHRGIPGGDASFGVFELRRRYDELGRTVEMSCHGRDGKGVQCGSTGYHALLSRYDDAGREVEQRFLAVDRAPTTNIGTAIRRFEYDSYDHLSVSGELDAAGQPIGSNGMASYRQLYDPGHRRFAMLLYDRQERPARYTGCFVGVDCPGTAWHAVRIVRTPEGKVVSNIFFDHAARRIHTTDCAISLCFE